MSKSSKRSGRHSVSSEKRSFPVGQIPTFVYGEKLCVRKCDVLDLVGTHRARQLKYLDEKQQQKGLEGHKYLLHHVTNLNVLKSAEPRLPNRTSHLVVYSVELARFFVRKLLGSNVNLDDCLQFPSVTLYPENLKGKGDKPLPKIRLVTPKTSGAEPRLELGSASDHAEWSSPSNAESSNRESVANQEKLGAMTEEMGRLLAASTNMMKAIPDEDLTHTHEESDINFTIHPCDFVYVPVDKHYVTLLGSGFDRHCKCFVRRRSPGGFKDVEVEMQFISPEVVMCWLPPVSEPHLVEILVVKNGQKSPAVNFHYVLPMAAARAV